LRCQKKRKKRYASGRSKRGQIAHRRSINTRPASVETRHQVGHWEVDTIIGKNHQGTIVSLIERKSGLAKLKMVAHKSALLVSNAIIEMLQSVPQAVISITSDNGKEFTMHQVVDAALGCTSYFADPYCSWQRGSNENANGLVRQYVAKNRMMSTVTDQEVQMIEDKLNARPRKRHDFKSPEDIFYTSIYRRALRA
jgi:transposase, IS30 family